MSGIWRVGLGSLMRLSPYPVSGLSATWDTQQELQDRVVWEKLHPRVTQVSGVQCSV